MRVLLASPESGVWTSRKHIPLGLGYLAAVLREAGHPVAIYDAAVEDEPLETVVRRGGYEMLGITAATPLIKDAWNMAKEGKRLGMITVLGGPHLTLMPEESVGPEHPEVDYVVKGEAEESIIELVDAIEGRRAMETVHGLYWRARTGRSWSTRPRAWSSNLDAIPYPAHDLFKINRYTNLQPLTDGLDKNARAFTIMTSRGCPYKCTYCSKPITGDTWRGALGRQRDRGVALAGARPARDRDRADGRHLEPEAGPGQGTVPADRRRGAEHGAVGDRARDEGQPRGRGAVPADEGRGLQAGRASAWRAATRRSCAT